MYELTQLFWYRPLFMTELLLGEIMFVYRLGRHPDFFKRLPLAILFCYIVAFAFPIASYSALYCSFMFICLFAATVLALRFIFTEPVSNLLYCAIAGYTVQHVAFEIHDLLVVILGLNGGAPLDFYGSTVFTIGQMEFPFIQISSEFYLLALFLYILFKNLIYLFVYIGIYSLVWVLFGSKLQKNDILQLKTQSVFVLAIIIILVDVVFSSIITYSVRPEGEISTDRIMIYIYNIFCCFLALYIQFELPVRNKLKRDLETANHLRHHEQEQYKISKENIELINMKCHDLRHQIRSIGTKSALSNGTVEEIESVVSIYDSYVKTGNETLDIIFTEKSLVCGKKNIRFSCMVDGVGLNFINESDLYSLFGNMIENAIEAVENLEEDKRIISLSVKRVSELLVVNIHNYFSGNLNVENGNFMTTKGDKAYHGYGLKSITAICEKYGGEISISADDDVFNINIIFPMTDA